MKAIQCSILFVVVLAAIVAARADDVVRIPNPDPQDGDSFGSAVAVTGTGLVAVGAPEDDTFGENAGAVYLFEDAVLIATLSAEVPSPGSLFGTTLALYGDRLVVGAPHDGGSGAVYVFDLNSGPDWEREATLVPRDEIVDGSFGNAVAEDRKTIVVGAPFENAGRPQSGAVYVFEQAGGNWRQTARIVLPGTPGVLIFGSSVAVQRDTIVAGAPFLRFDYIPGSAYVIERQGKGWVLKQRLFSPISTPRDRFGAAAVISGGTISVGAPRDLPPPFGYVASFRLDDATTWEAEGAIASPSPTTLDRFGGALATDGARLLVGARGADSGAGAAFLFRREGGSWEYESSLTPSGLGEFDAFGTAVAISSGQRVVGAPGDSQEAPRAGAVYWFRNDGS
jgi:hypothetical protein